jgi:AcrR family transcriptional regulator
MATTPLRRRNRRGEGGRLREHLVDAAAELLRERGDARGLSVRAVTARAGVSPSALYLHFAGVEDLLAAVLDRSFAELRRYLLAAEAAHEGDPDAQLVAMGRAYLAFALERPGHYATIFGPRRDERAGGIDPALGDAAFEDLVRAVGRCMHPGDPREAHAVAASVWVEMHGMVTLRHALPRFPWPPVETMLEEVVSGHVRRDPPAR